MSELVELRMQQRIAHEIYRHQMLQRIPDPYPAMLTNRLPAARYTLDGVNAKLSNADLWNEFHQYGTEMIITKSGRRMFPSLRVSLSGLEDNVNYCVLLEMIPIGDCRYKFSGSQWVPAGGAEPQSPQRMYLHPNSPSLGSHWTSQPILFNKVKLTNNTLDNNGHIVLTSMHKYQPRLHIIKTSEPSEIPWAPQQNFTFPETEFVAVTAYQNDRITKLKIDNNPFAKGFRETGQSRSKRKNPTMGQDNLVTDQTTKATTNGNDSLTEIDENNENIKRLRSNSSTCSISSMDDSGLSISGSSSSRSSSNSSICGKITPTKEQHQPQHHHQLHLLQLHQQQQQQQQQQQHHHQQLQQQHNDLLLQQYHQQFMKQDWMDLAFSYLSRSIYPIYSNNFEILSQQHQQHQQNQQYSGIQTNNQFYPALNAENNYLEQQQHLHSRRSYESVTHESEDQDEEDDEDDVTEQDDENIDIENDNDSLQQTTNRANISTQKINNNNEILLTKKSNFTISAILGCDT